MDKNSWGTLYICATPIGNLGDITLRVLETLKNVECIAAEDTRHTLKLLNRYEIKKRLISCHEHNEKERLSELIALLKDGADIALVTDAGMPAISDPGSQVISECIREGIAVTVCPGANAAVTALVLSGLETGRYVFEGFLPRKVKERRGRIEALINEARTAVLYEAPHRIKKTLAELCAILGNRRIAIARELTKIHEEVIRTTLSEAVGIFSERDARGEYVIVIEGADETARRKTDDLSGVTVQEHVSRCISEGLSEMDAIKKAAKDRNVPKRVIYEAVKLKCKM